MRKIHNTKADTLYFEVYDAIADLAKSVKTAMKRTTLRAELTATIADAEKIINATEVFRSTSCLAKIGEQNQSPVPKPLTIVPTQQDTWTRNQASLVSEPLVSTQDTWTRSVSNHDAVAEIHVASNLLEKAQRRFVDKKKRVEGRPFEKPPILRLYDQLGGFIKR
jgi:hypothetical protein